ncbi:MAG TPA: lyase family protein [Streptosporangiaceae bacterium]
MSGPGPDGLFGALFAAGRVAIDDEQWLQAILDVEAALARALERAGLAPAGAGGAVTEAARAGQLDATELRRHAALTGNPVPGVVRALSARLPPGPAGAVHRGATSQDIIDTALMVLSSRALTGTLADLETAAGAAAALASAHRDTVMIGRTLLQQAVPVTFGLVAAGWLTGLDEARRWLARVQRDRLAVQFGGAAGTLASLGEAGPGVAVLLAEELGLGLPVLPWHADRLRIVELAAALAGACAAAGKVARDVTLLAQSEVAEVSEGDGAPPDGQAGPAAGSGRRRGEHDPHGEHGPAHEHGPHHDHGPRGGRRGGSSAMPHKHNPVAAVVILGCARQAPGLLATVAASAEHELQRAAGAWHAEWQPLAGLLTLTGSAAAWAAQLLGGLRVDTARMRANLEASGGLPLAENVAALLSPALGPLPAHDLVARASSRAAAAGGSLGEALRAADLASQIEAAGVTAAQIAARLDPASYLGSAGRFVDAALAAYRASEGKA